MRPFLAAAVQGGAMSKAGLIRMGAWIGGLLVSYGACFGILGLQLPIFPVASRIGLLCALLCSVGANVFFWATILAVVAKKRGWSPRNCRTASLLVMLPGTILFLAGGPVTGTINVLLQEAVWTGFLCIRFVYPNFSSSGPFDPDAPITLFLK
jgi:hypothetical protein